MLGGLIPGVALLGCSANVGDGASMVDEAQGDRAVRAAACPMEIANLRIHGKDTGVCSTECYINAEYQVEVSRELYESGYRPFIEWEVNLVDTLFGSFDNSEDGEIELDCDPGEGDDLVVPCSADEKITVAGEDPETGEGPVATLSTVLRKENAELISGPDYKLYFYGDKLFDKESATECMGYAQTPRGELTMKEAAGLPKQLADAEGPLHDGGDDDYFTDICSKDDPLSELARLEGRGSNVGVTSAEIRLPPGFGRLDDGKARVELYHHWAGDLNVELYHRAPDAEEFEKVARLLTCTPNRQKELLELTVDLPAGESLDGVWEVRVYDFDQDSTTSYRSGRNAMNALNLFQIEGVRPSP